MKRNRKAQSIQSGRKKQKTETALQGAQMSSLAKIFKSAIINVLKELKETIFSMTGIHDDNV